MIYDELYRYFILHKQLNIPGIGHFQLQRSPASGDFNNKRVDPPLFTIVFGRELSPSKKIFSWLAVQLNITESEAVRQFNEFADKMKKQILNGDHIQWKGMGALSKGLSGNISFEPAKTAWTTWEPVHADKIIRENEEHTVKVGEREFSSTEMTELLHQPETTRSFWWAYALVAVLAAIIYIALHLSQYGLDPASSGNQVKLVPQTSPAPYSISQ